MSHNIIHFRCEGGMYCLVLKHAVEEINLSMVEARICKKVGLDECNVKLKLSYIPLLVGSDEKFVRIFVVIFCPLIKTTVGAFCWWWSSKGQNSQSNFQELANEVQERGNEIL